MEMNLKSTVMVIMVFCCLALISMEMDDNISNPDSPFFVRWIFVVILCDEQLLKLTIALMNLINDVRDQFHQHFTCAFFVQKPIEQLFSD